MNNEIDIDLRKVIRTVWTYRVMILILMLAAGGITAAVSMALQPLYPAQVLIAITSTRYLANFDPRYQTMPNASSRGQAYVDIANSDEIMRSVYLQWQGMTNQSMSLDDFRKQVATAELGNDTTYIRLTVKMADAQQSAQLANDWAAAVVQRANQVYGSGDQQDLSFFQEQLSQSDQKVKSAEAALVEFESRNQLSVLTNQRDALLSAQKEGMQKQRFIFQAQDDARSLLQSASLQDAETAVSTADLLSWYTLRARLYARTILVVDEEMVTTRDSSIQVQLPATSETIQVQLPATSETISIKEFRKLLADWIQALDDQVERNQTAIDGISSQVTDLNRKIQEISNEKEKLTLEYKTAVETYTTLLRKVDEVRIANQTSTGTAKISAAAVPIANIDRHILRNTVLAGVIALLAGILSALILSWWRTQ